MTATVWKLSQGELSLEHPLVMGIINATPDSFFDGGQYNTIEAAIERGRQLTAEGAHILDIGGESTRPGSRRVNAQEELDRVIPVVEGLAGKVEAALSIDTTKPEVARAAVEAGAVIINDVDGLRNPAMAEAVVDTGAAVVIMHMQGTPENMQKNPHYDDPVAEIFGFLTDQARKMEELGIDRGKICLDPGIGFGKRLSDNLAVLNQVDQLVASGYPVLIGASRKSYIKMILPEDTARLHGSVTAHVLSVGKGAQIVRVHDVAATVEALRVAAAIWGAVG